MKNLFYMGGPLFMGLLTALLIIMLAWAIYHFLPVLLHKETGKNTALRLKHIRTIGSFALVTGILAQLIGLYSAFSAVEQMGGVSPAMLMGGLKVSMITTLYGLVIYLLSLLIWFIADHILYKKAKQPELT